MNSNTIDTVLFVDNEEVLVNSLDTIFSDFDLKILSAASASEALEYFQEEEIAVIISDNQIPGMNGIDLLIKVGDISPSTLKILMASTTDLCSAVDAVNKGEVFRFISKPWDSKALKRTVREAVSRYQLVQSMRNANEETLLALAESIELIDPFTDGHCERVSNYSLMIADAINMSSLDQKELKSGSWLHDCGKSSVPEKIITKVGSLNDMEFEVIKNHPRWGAEIAQEAKLSNAVINIILNHHERFDGTGYPSGLRGSEIPLEARIVTIADVFDALMRDRPYRSKMSLNKSVEVMHAMKHLVFDPELLDIFIYECLKIKS